MESNIFHTPFGEAIATEKGVWYNPYTGTTSIVWDCSVVTPDGIVEGEEILVPIGETLTQQRVNSASSCATPKGRTANRAKTEEIRKYIKSLRKS